MNPEETAKKWMNAMNKHDASGLASVYASDTVAHDPLYPAPLKGVDAIRKDAEIFFKAFPDLKVKLKTVAAKGNIVIGEVSMAGTNSGPLESPNGTIPATNKRIDMQGAFTARVNSKGLIVEEHRYYDTASMMRSLGIMG